MSRPGKHHSHGHSHATRLHTHPLTSEAILDFRRYLADHRRAIQSTPEARAARRGAWLGGTLVAILALPVLVLLAAILGMVFDSLAGGGHA